MFCPNCGNNCPDNVTNCPNCGHAFAQAQQPQYQAPQQPYGQAPYGQAPYGQAPFSYDPPIQESTGGLLAWSIIILLLCTIPGIVALIMTTGINSCATRTEQLKKKANAKTWCIVGTVLSALYVIGTFVLGFVGALMSY